MRAKREPVPRAKEAWLWIGSTAVLGLLGAGVTAAAMMLWEHVDVRQLTPGLARANILPVAEAAVLPASDESEYSAVLFNSPRNKRFFPSSTHYVTELAAWRELLRSTGADVREVTDANGLRSARATDVLVLPEAPCLSADERAAIRGHVAAGGSVVSNWAVGVRNERCEWTDFSAIMELTGAGEVQELADRKPLFFTVPAGVPLAPGFDPGTRIELAPLPSFALRMNGPRVFWSDWALNVAPDKGGLGTDAAAVAIRTRAGGRSTWFGFRASQGATRADSAHVRRIMQNGLLWAAGTMMASVAPWPGGARAAMVFALDVEEKPQNARRFADFLSNRHIPGTFFAVTRAVGEDTALWNALGRVGEVASQTVDHQPVGGLTFQNQWIRLRRSWDDIERGTGRAPAGFRPPEDAFDSLTLRAWARLGGEYLLTRNEARSASPEIHGTGKDSVVVLPRLLKDDYNIIVQDHALRAARISEELITGVHKLRAIGGLAVIAGHTQIINSTARMDAFRTIADTAAAQGDWWIASARQVAKWWRARAGASVAFATSRDLSDIIVRAPTRDALENIWVDVVVPEGAHQMTPLVNGLSVEFTLTDWGMRVPVGSLNAGATRRISFVRDTTASEHVRK